MYARIVKYPLNKSFFLFGPRGTGKTSWVKTEFKDALYIDLLKSDLYTRLLARPQSIVNMIEKNFKGWIIIDEIQRVPELLNEVHRLIEDESYKFILTGSSARKLRKKGVNLLAGRAITRFMNPLSSEELNDDFNLQKSLLYGQLPYSYVYEDPKSFLSSYVETYLREEIFQEGLVRNLPSFARFLESASFSQGSALNVSELARDCSVKRKTVESFFCILEDLLIAERIPVFTKKAKRRMLNQNKFYFFDVGVYRALRPNGPLDKPEEIDGVAFETLLYQNIKAVNNSYDLAYEIFYWRTATKHEVDFVLYGEKGLIAIEIKRTANIKKKMLDGLKLFLKDYPIAKTYFIYAGEDKLYIDGIQVIPFEEFLKNIKTYL